MSEPQNPFEAALNQADSAAANPFEQSAPAVSLGSETDAVNPFAAPAQPQVVSLGSEAAAPNPFEAPAQAITAPVAEAVNNPSPPAMQPQIPTTPLASQPIPASVMQPAPQFTGNDTGQVQMFAAAAPAPVAPAEATAQNPIAMAIEQQEATVQVSIYAKLPVFEHGSVKEEIEDITQTFEDLRAAKAEDFPELEDANRVSWEVTYGKIRKMVYGAEAKKKKIGEFKSAIETSKEFIDGLKKSKEKNPTCTVKAKVTAQSKGERMPSYKGIFTSLEEAEASGKAICIVPGSDGKVYEIRNEEAGTFVMPVSRCKELPEIKAGFIPALPLIPRAQLMQIITFFRSLLFTDAGGSYEAIANIMWDKQRQMFFTCIPEQVVSAVWADSDLTLSEVLDSGRFLHYMDIHSHNLMPARFSQRDDRDEKATRLYAVIGRLDRFMPEISVRMGCGGKHLRIDPGMVFEPFWEDYPGEWHSKVTFSESIADELADCHESSEDIGLSLLPFLEKDLLGDAA